MKFNATKLIYHKIVAHFLEFDLNDLTKDYENKGGIIFDEYRDKDFTLLDDTLHNIRDQWFPFTLDDVEARLAAGHMLFIAKINGKIIGLFWVAVNKFDYYVFHELIFFKADEVYDYNDFVLEEYRGKNIIKNLKAYAFNILKQRGFNKVFAYVQSENKSSLRAFEKIGFRIMGKTTGIRIMTLEFRYNNFHTDKIVFQGGTFRLWKVLFRKIIENFSHKTA